MKSMMLILLLAGCGDAVSGSSDMSAPDGAPCTDNSQCGSAQYVCAFKIADGCAAKGHCARVATPTCASIVELCGCSGQPVPSGACFYADGYAGGPTTGAKSCTDGGI
jgi:hypothetical protein